MGRDNDRPLDRSMTRAFVGRERELAELCAALTAALAGRGQLLLLVGEPGIDGEPLRLTKFKPQLAGTA